MVIASFVLSVTALVLALMALPTVFQMIWGRPKVVILFREGADSSLRCEFEQSSVCKWIRYLGVRRTPVEICAMVVITQRGEGVAVNGLADLRHFDRRDQGFKFLTIHPHVASPVDTVVAVWQDGRCHCMELDQIKELVPGSYEATVIAQYAGADIARETRKFTVTVRDVHWAAES